MANLHTKEEGNNILKAHLQAIKNFHEECLADLNDIVLSKRSLTNRAKAVVFNNWVSDKGKEYFNSQKITHCAIVEKYQSTHIILDNQIILRFKKLTQNKLSRNNSTKRNNAIINQLPQLFPEYDRRTYVEAGYIINALWTDIKVMAVCRFGTNNIWEIEIDSTMEKPNITTVGSNKTSATTRNKNIRIKKTNNL
jgi:hypothetical protein